MPDATKQPFAEKLAGVPHSKGSLRLWLRLLSCSKITESRIRARLEKSFATTLPRFDVLAALYRSPNGLTMSELSSATLTSNGNVTGIVSRLIKESLIIRLVDSRDRRVSTIRLTPKGRTEFRRMANAHEKWIDRTFANLSDDEITQLLKLLGVLRQSIDDNPI